MLGARTYLLSRLDDNTRRLHPQAAAEALSQLVPFEQPNAQIILDVTQARDRQVETVLYIVYAGHGSVEGGQGYIALEDVRITGGDLARIVGDIPASSVHIIVDSCASYYLAYSRGPGGERRSLTGFQDSAELANDPRVGLLLSTSSARESHEWEGFQAGVFSYEVRSGLYGAADANGDGRVSYREIAAFVNRANSAIPNERFRPNIHVRAPSRTDTLLDLRHGLDRRLEIDGAHPGHYSIEDARGVRILDLHNSEGQALHVVRSRPSGPVYVHRMEDDTEFMLPSTPDVVSLSELEAGRPRVAIRGAAQEAYHLLFSLPFDRAVVEAYVDASTDDYAAAIRTAKPADIVTSRPVARRPVLAWGSLGLGAIAGGAAAYLSVSAAAEASGAPPRPSEAEAARRNARISTLEIGAAAGYIGGGS